MELVLSIPLTISQKLGQNVGQRAFSTFICLPHNCGHTWSAANYGLYYDSRQKELGAFKWNNCRTHRVSNSFPSLRPYFPFFSRPAFYVCNQYISPFSLSVISTEGALRLPMTYDNHPPRSHPTHPIPQSLLNHLNRPWIDLS